MANSEIRDAGPDVPFSAQAVLDGHWEIYHDDDCDGIITPENLCLKCGMHPDFQSRGARRVKAVPVSAPVPQSNWYYVVDGDGLVCVADPQPIHPANLAARKDELGTCPTCEAKFVDKPNTRIFAGPPEGNWAAIKHSLRQVCINPWHTPVAPQASPEKK